MTRATPQSLDEEIAQFEASKSRLQRIWGGGHGEATPVFDRCLTME